MRITLSKFILAKLEYDDPAADEVPPWVLLLTSGSFKKEKNLVWIKGGSR